MPHFAMRIIHSILSLATLIGIGATEIVNKKILIFKTYLQLMRNVQQNPIPAIISTRINKIIFSNIMCVISNIIRTTFIFPHHYDITIHLYKKSNRVKHISAKHL